jgi:hypothetical protein
VSSTITAATVTALTTAAAPVLAGMSLLAIVTLLGMVIAREVASTRGKPHSKALGRALDVAIVPLLLAFLLIMTASLIEVLR